MHYRRLSGGGILGGGILGFPPAVSNIVLVSGIVFLLQQLLPPELLHQTPRGLIPHVPKYLALVPNQVTHGMVWQLVTYLFLHGGIWHFVFNMFGLVIFGSTLERYWGSREFYKYYLVTGIGAGVIQVLATYLFGDVTWMPVIGASGAIFGVAVAYAMAFPHHQILLWLVVPVSARTMVILYLFMEVARVLQTPMGGGVARFAHLGGALVGYLYLKNETLFFRARRWWGRIQATVEQSRKPSGGRAHDEERVNEILDKINREPDGIASLTEEERQFLHDARRRKESQDR